MYKGVLFQLAFAFEGFHKILNFLVFKMLVAVVRVLELVAALAPPGQKRP